MTAVTTQSSRLGRVYVDMTRGLRAPGATTVLDQKAKQALPRWAALECGRYVERNHHLLPNMTPAEARDAVKAAPWHRSGSAASVGTDVHEVVDLDMRGEPVGD